MVVSIAQRNKHEQEWRRDPPPPHVKIRDEWKRWSEIEGVRKEKWGAQPKATPSDSKGIRSTALKYSNSRTGQKLKP